MHQVNVVTKNHMGLAMDVRLVTRLLAARGLESRVFMARIRNRIGLPARLMLRAAMLAGAPMPRANVLINNLRPEWLGLARRNILIPNHEFFGPESVALLGRVDLVMCKTRVAEQAFRDAGATVRYTGFTTPDDPYDPAVPRDRNRFLHVAGTTVQKGTRPLLDLWLAHPQWPELVAVVRQQWADPAIYRAANITLITQVVPPAAMAVLQNRCAVHICPSEAEGFGHVLCEGMACAAVVITTDGAPMNELVRPGHGVLVACRETRPKDLATAYFVDPDALAAAVDRVIAMDDGAFAAMGQRARAAWLDGRQAFETRFRDAWDSVA